MYFIPDEADLHILLRLDKNCTGAYTKCENDKNAQAQTRCNFAAFSSSFCSPESVHY